MNRLYHRDEATFHSTSEDAKLLSPFPPCKTAHEIKPVPGLSDNCFELLQNRLQINQL